MSLVAVSVAEREVGSRFEACALDRDRAAQVEAGLASLIAEGVVVEAAVVATCARSELYLAAPHFHAAVERSVATLASALGVERTVVEQLATVHFGTGALRHLYRVAAGMESAIVGESEVVAQVKAAIERARARRLARGELSHIFERALEVAKEVRSSTQIAHGAASVVTMASDLALAGSEASSVAVGVVGTGAVGTEVARVLTERGAQVTVLTRRDELLREPPEGWRVRPLAELGSVLSHLDAVVLATAATSTILTPSMVPRDHPVRVVDLCRPRAADPGLAAVEGVRLVDLEEVNRLVAGQLERRQEAMTDAELVIERALGQDGALLHAGELNPTLALLYERAEALRRAELERALRRVGDDEAARRALEELSHRLVRKLLHGPSSALRKASSSADDLGPLLAALRSLFDL